MTGKPLLGLDGPWRFTVLSAKVKDHPKMHTRVVEPVPPQHCPYLSMHQKRHYTHLFPNQFYERDMEVAWARMADNMHMATF